MWKTGDVTLAERFSMRCSFLTSLLLSVLFITPVLFFPLSPPLSVWELRSVLNAAKTWLYWSWCSADRASQLRPPLPPGLSMSSTLDLPAGVFIGGLKLCCWVPPSGPLTLKTRLIWNSAVPQRDCKRKSRGNDIRRWFSLPPWTFVYGQAGSDDETWKEFLLGGETSETVNTDSL